MYEFTVSHRSARGKPEILTARWRKGGGESFRPANQRFGGIAPKNRLAGVRLDKKSPFQHAEWKGLLYRSLELWATPQLLGEVVGVIDPDVA
jgi:hypothetical protein